MDLYKVETKFDPNAALNPSSTHHPCVSPSEAPPVDILLPPVSAVLHEAAAAAAAAAATSAVEHCDADPPVPKHQQ